MAGAVAAHHARWGTHNSPVSVLGPRQARSRELDRFVASARLSAREQTPAQHCQEVSICSVSRNIPPASNHTRSRLLKPRAFVTVCRAQEWTTALRWMQWLLQRRPTDAHVMSQVSLAWDHSSYEL